MTMNSYPKFPKAVNETVKEYRPNSPEKEAVLKSYRTLFKENTQVPLTINGEKITTETKGKCAPSRSPAPIGEVLFGQST